MVTIDSDEGVAISGFQHCFILMWVDQNSSFTPQHTESEEAILRQRQKRGKEEKNNNGEHEQRGTDLQRAQLHVSHTHSKLGMIAHREHIHIHTQEKHARVRVFVTRHRTVCLSR